MALLECHNFNQQMH